MNYFDNEVHMHIVSGPNAVFALKKVLDLDAIEVESYDVETIKEECFNMDIAIGIVQVD